MVSRVNKGKFNEKRLEEKEGLDDNIMARSFMSKSMQNLRGPCDHGR